MITEKQRAANRLNAQKSTGPRTAEGKARSSQNARKHSFTATTFAVVRLEDQEEVAHLKADLVDVYQPANSQELFAVERIALTQQTILRAARLETGLCTSCLSEALFPDGEPFMPLADRVANDIEVTRAQNRNFALAHGFEVMAQTANTWSLFMRYQTLAERNYRRAIEEFERLKALRRELPNEPIFDPQPEPNTATSTHFPVNPSTPGENPPAPSESLQA